MRLQVKGKNVELSPALKDYAQKKLGKLERHLNDSARVELELAAERNPSIGSSQIAEATVWT
ncbi:MAG: ribosome-associated translation inhibitor RaiA, partial [Thermoleophilia bacterium]|nr:ribosome-associated translation inhibitor RaiA [Thermoleophilia bacterium]